MSLVIGACPSMVAQGSSSKCVQVGNTSKTSQPLSSPQAMQAIIYNSNVTTESHLLAEDSVCVLES